MDYRNYIFLDDELKNKPIYRIFPITRFLQVLETKKLTLVKPHRWDDPFENALLNSTLKIDGVSCRMEARNSVYGQCWTQHRETDAMWRIYSHSKDGVRLSTTPKKLLDALMSNERNQSNCADIRCFIGKVKYQTKKQLINSFSEIRLFNTNGSGIAESLLYKRKEFSHEKEIRLIYSGDDGKCNQDIFQFEIEPNNLFDSILFDPRMEKCLRKVFVSGIKKLGCQVKVKRSTLYDPS